MFKIKPLALLSLLMLFVLSACDDFEELNENPNEPTEVSADVLLPNAIRNGVNTTVDASFLVGNNAAQLTAKALRVEVDAYNWNAFPTYWEGWYEALTDVKSMEDIALETEDQTIEAVAVILRSWLFANLTNAYGDIPYFEAIQGDIDNFTPVYDSQQEIYADLLSELSRADDLLDGVSSEQNIAGDILLNGDPVLWRKFGNSLRLRLLMTANNKISDAGTQFSAIVEEGMILQSNDDNIALTYTGSFPNEFPLLPLKEGDFDAVVFSKTSFDVMSELDDPRLMRYARPNNDEFSAEGTYSGAINGCASGGARLGVQYYNYPDLRTAASLGLPIAEGIIMTYAEVEFLLAEAASKGWIGSDVAGHYEAGIRASMEYHLVNLEAFGWNSFDDYYNNSGVAYEKETDIWEQKWLALFFHGMEPYFEVRRWYYESGFSFDGIPFLSATCDNQNDDRLPLRFLYPGEEQSLNAANYETAVSSLGGNSQNGRMWLMTE